VVARHALAAVSEPNVNLTPELAPIARNGLAYIMATEGGALRMSLSFPRVAGSLVSAVFAFLLSVFAGLWWDYGIWQAVAGAAALQAVVAVCCAVLVAVKILSCRSESDDSLLLRDTGVMAPAALFHGVAAAAGLFLLLAVRLWYAVSEAISLRYPPVVPDLGVGSAGYWGFGLLVGAVVLFWVPTRDPRLVTCLYALVAAIAGWAALEWPVHGIGADGGLEAGGASYVMLGSTASMLGLVGAVRRPSRFASEWRRAEPASEMAIDGTETSHGLHIPCGLQAVLLVLLVCYHVVVPIRPPWFDCRAAVMASSLAAALGALGCATFVRGPWCRLFIDAGLALVVLAIGSATLTVVPCRTIPLVQRYPETMNALMVGFTIAMGVITWAFMTGRHRRAEGDFWSFPAARVVDLQRFAFLSGALGLVAAGLMALWPRMRFVAVADDSIGRILAGFGAHLFMLLVMLICARRIKRRPFHLLALMAFASTIGFMLLRMYPYTPGFG